MGDSEGTKKPKGTENDVQHDPHYEPIISLPLQEVKTLEEDESEIFKMRAKLYRWAPESDPPEWKERGTGDLKLLQHKNTKKVRLLMRRDKTLKICANHFVQEYMNLSAHMGSERAWVWNVPADFADEEPKQELLAVRFYNAENSKKFKDMFDKAREINKNITADDSDEKNNAPEVKEEEKEQETEEKNGKDVQDVIKNVETLKIDKTDQSCAKTEAKKEAEKSLKNGS